MANNECCFIFQINRRVSVIMAGAGPSGSGGDPNKLTNVALGDFCMQLEDYNPTVRTLYNFFYFQSS